MHRPPLPPGNAPGTRSCQRLSQQRGKRIVKIIYIFNWGRYISVGIATRFGLDGLGIESRCGARFTAPVQTVPGAHPASYAVSTGSFPGVNRPGRGVDHPPPSSAEVKERAELYLYSPFGPPWPILG